MKKQEIVTLLREHAAELKKFGVRRLALFGSVLRDQVGEESDIDVLVELAPKTFDNYMGLKFFLEQLLGRRVDLVLLDALKPLLKPRILEEAEFVEGL